MSAQPIVSTLAIDVEDRSSDRIAALFDTHYQRLYRLARRLTPTTDDALDLVQETFLRAARRPKSVPVGAEREEAWLVRILINLRRDQWRKAAVQKRHHEPPLHSEPDPSPAVIARMTVWRALDKLPPRRRAIVVMHELEGLPISTIASQLGISAITVRWHLAAARRHLARVLLPRHGDKHDGRP